jgi:hypothetical protein
MAIRQVSRARQFGLCEGEGSAPLARGTRAAPDCAFPVHGISRYGQAKLASVDADRQRLRRNGHNPKPSLSKYHSDWSI